MHISAVPDTFVLSYENESTPVICEVRRLSIRRNCSARAVGICLAVPTKCIEEACVVCSVVVHELNAHFVAFPNRVGTVGPVDVTFENVDVSVVFTYFSLCAGLVEPTFGLNLCRVYVEDCVCVIHTVAACSVAVLVEVDLEVVVLVVSAGVVDLSKEVKVSFVP